MNTASKTPIDLSTPPTSFSAFKPVGRMVIGFPDDESCERAAQELRQTGTGDPQQVPSADMQLRMAQMLDLAHGSAEFGHEIVEMRRFLSLSAQGYGWLIVPATIGDESQRIIAIVEPLGARIAVHYGTLIITDLL
jgi:hypothetical protein